MSSRNVESADAYVKLVQASFAERAELYRYLLIGKTAFFRDTEVFDHLQRRVLPALLSRAQVSEPLRLWVAGCSTGEEAYSVLIALLETMHMLGLNMPVQMFASDVDEGALSIARRGIYPHTIHTNVSARHLKRYFVHIHGGYQVLHSLRSMIVFGHHDLTRDAPYSRMHVVSCRNVLMYLAHPMRDAVMRKLHYALRPHGCLVLGTAESARTEGSLFTLFDAPSKVYIKKPFPKHAHSQRGMEPQSNAVAPELSVIDGAELSDRGKNGQPEAQRNVLLQRNAALRADLERTREAFSCLRQELHLRTEELRRTRHELATLLGTLGVSVAIIRPDSSTAVLTTAACRLLGLRADTKVVDLQILGDGLGCAGLGDIVRDVRESRVARTFTFGKDQRMYVVRVTPCVSSQTGAPSVMLFVTHRRHVSRPHGPWHRGMGYEHHASQP
jgi:chemotaxis methyl-accepting protein methylase